MEICPLLDTQCCPCEHLQHSGSLNTGRQDTPGRDATVAARLMFLDNDGVPDGIAESHISSHLDISDPSFATSSPLSMLRMMGAPQLRIFILLVMSFVRDCPP